VTLEDVEHTTTIVHDDSMTHPIDLPPLLECSSTLDITKDVKTLDIPPLVACSSPLDIIKDTIINNFLNITLPSLHSNALPSKDEALVDEELSLTLNPLGMDVEHNKKDNNVNSITINRLITPTKGIVNK